MDLAALIFDVDGTLADTERDGHRPAFNAAFADAGLDWSWSVELYGELLKVTGGKERIRYYIERFRPDFEPARDLTGFIADLHRRKTEHYLRMLRGGAIPLRPGVLRLLREARDAGIRLAIATTTTPENVTTLLECSGEPGLPSWFEVIAAGDVVPAKKPAPDIYRLALDQLGLPAHACVAVEDSANGLRSALAADIRAVLVLVAPTRNGRTSQPPRSWWMSGGPGAPAHVLHGTLDGSDYVDLAALRALHNRACGTASQ